MSDVTNFTSVPPAQVHLWEWGDKVATQVVTIVEEQTFDSAVGTTFDSAVNEIIKNGTMAKLMNHIEFTGFFDPGRRTDRTVPQGELGRASRFYERQYRDLLMSYVAEHKARISNIIQASGYAGRASHYRR